jgi:uncharacterized protein YkwD
MQPLQHNRQLDRAAALWAAGGSPATAILRTGYEAQSVVGLRLRGPDDAILQALRRSRCRAMAVPSLTDVGMYRSGPRTWLLIAAARANGVPAPRSAPVPAPSSPPSPSPSRSQSSATLASTWQPEPSGAASYSAYPGAAHGAQSLGPVSSSRLGSRVLELVNQVRASGTRCGGRSFGPAPPLQMSGTLDAVASQHAQDMARHGYFEHVDLTGHSPSDRVRAIGYHEKLVGENIAYGPTSADEVVAGWLHSTGHCENIMDPRFVEMGLAYATGQGAKRGPYWDQVLTAPAR